MTALSVWGIAFEFEPSLSFKNFIKVDFPAPTFPWIQKMPSGVSSHVLIFVACLWRLIS
jgi:hypothetical protein